MNRFFNICNAKLVSGKFCRLPVEVEQNGNVVRCTVKAQSCAGVEYIDFGKELINPRAGDEGYFVVPQGHQNQDSFITFFSERENSEYSTIGLSYFLGVFGIKHRDISFSARLVGMKETVSKFIVGIKDGRYCLYPRFVLGGDGAYEDIVVEYTLLPFEEASYSRIAEIYRNYLLEKGVCVPIRDRLTPALEYAKDSLYVRIRLAWKPCPSEVLEQTEENEPDIHVACTFADVIAFMEECKACGIEKAEFCLVGYNKSGHDGRWPQIFPVEPLVGGEEELKRLIERAKELGYRISCHTNSTETYTIADCYDERGLCLKKDGEPYIDTTAWGGGRARKVCPERAYEFAKKELPKLKALGFNGLHYVDVISINSLLRCYDKEHPCNQKQSGEYYTRIGMLCRELFGGFCSEGGREHCISALDYALYITFRKPEISNSVFADRYIPLWQLVFHGIVLSNPYARTINVNKKPRALHLKLLEYGARPTYYLHSKFRLTSSIGDIDMLCSTDEERKESAKMMKELYDEYKVMSYLQTEFMTEHEQLPDGRIRVTYSDGSEMYIDYERETVQLYKEGTLIYEG